MAVEGAYGHAVAGESAFSDAKYAIIVNAAAADDCAVLVEGGGVDGDRAATTDADAAAAGSRRVASEGAVVDGDRATEFSVIYLTPVPAQLSLAPRRQARSLR